MPLGEGGIKVHGLREFSRDLKRLDAQFPKEMRKAGLSVAKLVADEAQAQAGAGTKVQRKAAKAIKARAGAARASVAVAPTSAIPFARGAFFGAKRYKQFDTWVGSNWRVGVRGEGPYAINPAIVSLDHQIVNVYGEAVRDIVKRAFPN